MRILHENPRKLCAKLPLKVNKFTCDFCASVTRMHTKREKNAFWRTQVSQQLQGGKPPLERNLNFAAGAV